MRRHRLNPCVQADSYKASHFLQYPPAQLMVCYAEFRTPYQRDQSDHRLIFYGLRYLIEEVLSVQWTIEDVDAAERFFSTHTAGSTPFAFPRDLFLSFIQHHDGYFPVRIEALPEGSVVHPHVPVFQVYARHEYSRLITYLETVLTHVWYASTVATLSRRTKDVIQRVFELTVDNDHQSLLSSRLHDFGYRGTTSEEQAIVGGCAHLLNFVGSDTMIAAYYAQMHLNQGRSVAQSIPASEHSVMTSFTTEEEATRRMIDTFGGESRVFSVVFDSYDYVRALDVMLPSVAPQLIRKGGTMVIRPDSGDPCECVLQALRAGEKVFGVDINGKGYKVLRHVAVIQGDGLSYSVVQKITQAVMDAGFSAECVAYGMGGGLLQRVNRDTMSFATKLSFLIDEQGRSRLVSKQPKDDGGKVSHPCHHASPLQTSNHSTLSSPHLTLCVRCRNPLADLSTRHPPCHPSHSVLPSDGDHGRVGRGARGGCGRRRQCHASGVGPRPSRWLLGRLRHAQSARGEGVGVHAQDVRRHQPAAKGAGDQVGGGVRAEAGGGGERSDRPREAMEGAGAGGE